MALPRAHRLKRRNDFSTVYQRGLRRSSAHLTLRALRCKKRVERGVSHAIDQDQMVSDRVGLERHQITVPPTQIGISISLKVSKRSTVRNRIKRQIRAALRQLLPDLSPGWWLVIVVKPNATECEYTHFLQELKQLLISAEVIHGHSGRRVL